MDKQLNLLKQEKKEHLYSAHNINDPHYNFHFHRALRKYEKDVWEWEIIEKNISIERLDLEEILAIYIYDAFYEGYNETFGGESPMRGKKAYNRI